MQKLSSKQIFLKRLEDEEEEEEEDEAENQTQNAAIPVRRLDEWRNFKNRFFKQDRTEREAVTINTKTTTATSAVSATTETEKNDVNISAVKSSDIEKNVNNAVDKSEENNNCQRKRNLAGKWFILAKDYNFKRLQTSFSDSVSECNVPSSSAPITPVASRIDITTELEMTSITLGQKQPLSTLIKESGPSMDCLSLQNEIGIVKSIFEKVNYRDNVRYLRHTPSTTSLNNYCKTSEASKTPETPATPKTPDYNIFDNYGFLNLSTTYCSNIDKFSSKCSNNLMKIEINDTKVNVNVNDYNFSSNNSSSNIYNFNNSTNINNNNIINNNHSHKNYSNIINISNSNNNVNYINRSNRYFLDNMNNYCLSNNSNNSSNNEVNINNNNDNNNNSDGNYIGNINLSNNNLYNSSVYKDNTNIANINNNNNSFNSAINSDLKNIFNSDINNSFNSDLNSNVHVKSDNQYLSSTVSCTNKKDVPEENVLLSRLSEMESKSSVDKMVFTQNDFNQNRFSEKTDFNQNEFNINQSKLKQDNQIIQNKMKKSQERCSQQSCDEIITKRNVKREQKMILSLDQDQDQTNTSGSHYQSSSSSTLESWLEDATQGQHCFHRERNLDQILVDDHDDNVVDDNDQVEGNERNALLGLPNEKLPSNSNIFMNMNNCGLTNLN